MNIDTDSVYKLMNHLVCPWVVTKLYMSLHQAILSFFSCLKLHPCTNGSIEGPLLNKTQAPSGLIKHFSAKRGTDGANECLMVADIHAFVAKAQ